MRKRHIIRPRAHKKKNTRERAAGRLNANDSRTRLRLVIMRKKFSNDNNCHPLKKFCENNSLTLKKSFDNNCHPLKKSFENNSRKIFGHKKKSPNVSQRWGLCAT